MKNILAENMRRFGTKNLTEQVNANKKQRHDTIAKQIASKLIGKTFKFGTIGVIDDATIRIDKYVDRNHAIDLEKNPVNEFLLYFDVHRIEKDGSDTWYGILKIGAIKTSLTSTNMTLDMQLWGKKTFPKQSTFPTDGLITWDTVGGLDLWKQAFAGSQGTNRESGSGTWIDDIMNQVTRPTKSYNSNNPVVAMDPISRQRIAQRITSEVVFANIYRKADASDLVVYVAPVKNINSDELIYLQDAVSRIQSAAKSAGPTKTSGKIDTTTGTGSLTYVFSGKDQSDARIKQIADFLDNI